MKATETTARGAPTAAPMFLFFEVDADVPVATGLPSELVEVEVCAWKASEGEEVVDEEADEDKEVSDNEEADEKAWVLGDREAMISRAEDFGIHKMYRRLSSTKSPSLDLYNPSWRLRDLLGLVLISVGICYESYVAEIEQLQKAY
ncbi:hypothetical protein MMC07_002057 [Pseudocyphellaria aurata]|nr:hypothetical protein [Pseudocyphellaria aurata]